jgi:hypothetical protein
VHAGLSSLLVAEDARAGEGKRRFSAINVVEATYGSNCQGVSKGNVTQALATA